jgi:hypothetical protein
MSNKIRILFLSANPIDMVDYLSPDKEIREIEDAIAGSQFGNMLEVRSRWAIRFSDLPKALLKHHPHIVHFSGHGFPQGIGLVNEFGCLEILSNEALGKILQILKGNIRIVFFNLCSSIALLEILKENIDFIIGMDAAIEDKASIAFASNFYRYLADGLPVKDAFELAKESFNLQLMYASSIPKLFIRSGLKDSESFLRGTVYNRLVHIFED